MVIIGIIDIPSDLEGDTIAIGDVNIKPEFRDKGLGVETYKAAMKVAEKPLESFMATDEANRVWNSLVKQGLAKKTDTGFVTVASQITSQQKQQAQTKFQEYVNQTGKQDIQGFKEFVSKSDVSVKEQVAALRAQEKLEIRKAIPTIGKYKNTYGKEQGTMPDSLYAIYKSIYDKYDALISPLLKTQQVEEGVEETSDRLLERKNLINTINPNVFVYNDLSGTEKAYKYIIDNNQDITFVYQFSLAQKQAYDKMTPQEFNKRKLLGQVLIKKLANSSSIGIITGQDKISDAFSKLESKYYPKRKAEIEQAIAEINQVIEDGGKVAFSMNGYGDPSLMPKELFVYLSKRLFEEFQYLNPGSEFAKEISLEVAKYQPVTDAEILTKFEGENNPLNCQ